MLLHLKLLNICSVKYASLSSRKHSITLQAPYFLSTHDSLLPFMTTVIVSYFLIYILISQNYLCPEPACNVHSPARAEHIDLKGRSLIIY